MSQTTEARWEQHNEAGCRHFGQGAYAEAEREFLAAIREASSLGPENLRLAASLNNLGLLKYRQRDLGQAEQLFRRSLTVREQLLGADHAAIAQSAANLATLYYARGELDAAEPLARRALTIRERGGDPNDPALATSRRLVSEIRAARASSPMLTPPVTSVASPLPSPTPPRLSPPRSQPPTVMLEPSPHSVMSVGALTPIGGVMSSASDPPPRRHAETRPAERREHRARTAPRDGYRTPASPRRRTMRPSRASATRASSAHQSSVFGLLLRFLVLLAVVAAGAWFAAGRPPLRTVVAAITRSASDSTPTRAGTEPQP